jgi:hypothetical protein
MADENQTPGPKAGQDPTKKKKGLGGLGKAQKKKEISKDNKRRIAYMDGAKETVTGGGMKADRFKEGLNIKGSKDSAMKFYARGDDDHGKLGQKKYKSLKNNTYAKGGRAGYKGGKSVKKKGGCAIKGKSPILR